MRGGGGDLFYALGESGIHRRRQTERESERDGESEREGGREMYVYNTIGRQHTRTHACVYACAGGFALVSFWSESNGRVLVLVSASMWRKAPIPQSLPFSACAMRYREASGRS